MTLCAIGIAAGMLIKAEIAAIDAYFFSVSLHYRQRLIGADGAMRAIE